MEIDVCGVPHKVIFRDRIGREDQNYGRYDGKDGRIFIDKEMTPEIRAVTLVHEWMHGVYEANGVEHLECHVAVMAAELYRQGFRIKMIKDS